ncbi:hypothetical protein CKAH01_06575 [Colletotrichum kahawae]|uniref:Uncharacterized protein n=1 Tax=Colletotrichum kahawae TaxID=34407 RepID=A0AAD9Y9M4_COLKA|nr:hypothetical protein CKAH01_06575 [Colletotrichum kahawae]
MRIMSTDVSGTLADGTPDASGTYLPSTLHQRQGANLTESHHISLTDTARPMIFNNIQRCQWAHAHRPEMVCLKSYAIRPSHRLDPRRYGQAQFSSRAVPLGHSGVRLAGPLRDNRRGEERKKQAPLTMQKALACVLRLPASMSLSTKASNGKKLMSCAPRGPSPVPAPDSCLPIVCVSLSRFALRCVCCAATQLHCTVLPASCLLISWIHTTRPFPALRTPSHRPARPLPTTPPTERQDRVAESFNSRPKSPMSQLTTGNNRGPSTRTPPPRSQSSGLASNYPHLSRTSTAQHRQQITLCTYNLAPWESQVPAQPPLIGCFNSILSPKSLANCNLGPQCGLHTLPSPNSPLTSDLAHLHPSNMRTDRCRL